MKYASCRSCGAAALETVIELGVQPPSNALLTSRVSIEKAYPLAAAVCTKCWLMQTTYDVPHDELFNDEYPYFSGQSASWVAHCQRYVEAIMAEGAPAYAVEVGGNDGTLLAQFPKSVKTLNVEPCASVAAASADKGIETLEISWKIVTLPQKADLIIMNNVLAHDPDINGVVAAIARNLSYDGVCTIEFPWVLNLLKETQFDTIYHEHYSYLSVTALAPLFARYGLQIADVEQIPTHGGSLRIYARHDVDVALSNARVSETLALEAPLRHMATYDGFRGRALACKYALQTFVFTHPNQIMAYGAAAKGNTFLNWCGYTERDIMAVADTTPAKIGKFLPGSRIPIVTPEQLLAWNPPYIWVLPWNWFQEIKWKLRAQGYKGTIFRAVPELLTSELVTSGEYRA